MGKTLFPIAMLVITRGQQNWFSRNREHVSFTIKHDFKIEITIPFVIVKFRIRQESPILLNFPSCNCLVGLLTSLNISQRHLKSPKHHCYISQHYLTDVNWSAIESLFMFFLQLTLNTKHKFKSVNYRYIFNKCLSIVYIVEIIQLTDHN